MDPKIKVERTNDTLKQEGGKIKYIQKDSIPALLSDLCIDDLTARRLQNDHLAIGGSSIQHYPSSEAIIREGDSAVKLLNGLLFFFFKPKLKCVFVNRG